MGKIEVNFIMAFLVGWRATDAPVCLSFAFVGGKGSQQFEIHFHAEIKYACFRKKRPCE